MYFKGQYPDLNREHVVPHTTTLPIELYYPLFRGDSNTKY